MGTSHKIDDKSQRLAGRAEEDVVTTHRRRRGSLGRR
jgi:hypothetical protein